MVIMPTDINRGAKFSSPLNEELVCHSMTGREQLGRLFEYQLDLFSTREDISFDEIVALYRSENQKDE